MSNVTPFPPRRRHVQQPKPSSDFEVLTAVLVMKAARERTLDPAIVAAFLQVIGLPVRDAP